MWEVLRASSTHWLTTVVLFRVAFHKIDHALNSSPKPNSKSSPPPHTVTQWKSFNTLPFLLSPSTVQNTEHDLSLLIQCLTASLELSWINRSSIHSMCSSPFPPSSYFLLILEISTQKLSLMETSLAPRLDIPIKCLHSTCTLPSYL